MIISDGYFEFWIHSYYWEEFKKLLMKAQKKKYRKPKIESIPKHCTWKQMQHCSECYDAYCPAFGTCGRNNN